MSWGLRGLRESDDRVHRESESQRTCIKRLFNVEMAEKVPIYTSIIMT